MGLRDRFKRKQVRQSVMIGLDGTPSTLLRRFAEDGTMPVTASLIARGTLLQMDTSVPDISSVAWSSFMTGANPGKHGIYGFLDLVPGSYKTYFPSSRHVKARRLWDVAGQTGLKSVVINVPSTYPAIPMTGMLVSGFVAVDLDRAVFPARVSGELRAMDYRIDVDARKVKESHDALLDDIMTTLDRRVTALLHYFDREEWDLFIGVITCTDRLQHFFMDAAYDPAHRYHGAFKEFYRKVDAFIAEMASRVGERHLLMMSDHGFTRIEKQVYLNRWLADNGFLNFRPGAKSIEDIAEGTLAFALDPGRIYLNFKGKFPLGTVSATDAARILDEIEQGVAAISDNGSPITKRIFRRDDLFAGPCLEAAPDMCVQGEYGYDLKGAVNKPDLMDREVFTGMHTQDDAMLYVGVPADHLEERRPNIVDVAPTLLNSIGVDVPPEMDGRSLLRP